MEGTFRKRVRGEKKERRGGDGPGGGNGSDKPTSFGCVSKAGSKDRKSEGKGEYGPGPGGGGN